MGKDIISNDRNFQPITQLQAKCLNKSRFSGSHGTGNTETQLTGHQLRNKREYNSA